MRTLIALSSIAFSFAASASPTATTVLTCTTPFAAGQNAEDFLTSYTVTAAGSLAQSDFVVAHRGAVMFTAQEIVQNHPVRPGLQAPIVYSKEIDVIEFQDQSTGFSVTLGAYVGTSRPSGTIVYNSASQTAKISIANKTLTAPCTLTSLVR